MKRLWTWPLCATLLIAGTRDTAVAADSTLIAFELQDQFKQIHVDSTFRGSTLVVLVANKGGSLYSRKWSRTLRDSLAVWSWTDRVTVLGVAHMSGVPFFLKGFVKGKLPKDPKDWLLLDWKGQFFKSYELSGDTCNVLLFDVEGRLRQKFAVGPVASGTLDSVRNLVDELLPLGIPEEAGAPPDPH